MFQLCDGCRMFIAVSTILVLIVGFVVLGDIIWR